MDRALGARLTNWLKRYSKLRFARYLLIRLSRNEAEDNERDVRTDCNCQGNQYAAIVSVAMQAHAQLIDSEPRPSCHDIANHS